MSDEVVEPALTLEEQLKKRIRLAERAGYERARKELEEGEEREVLCLRRELESLRRNHDVRDRKFNGMVAGRVMRLAYFGAEDRSTPARDTLTLVFVMESGEKTYEQELTISGLDLRVSDRYGSESF